MATRQKTESKSAKTAKPTRTAKPATASKAAKPAKAAKSPKPAPDRITLAEVMKTLEKAGSAKTRETYLRHGAAEPLFGVSFATLKTLYKKIRVDHELALALWDTGNFDARNLAVKIVDPERLSPKELDRWASMRTARMCAAYVACVASESGHGRARAEAWLKAREPWQRSVAWSLVSALAMRDESIADSWFAQRLAEIEKTIHDSHNDQREAMNSALISIGGRNAALRKSALAAAKRIGKVEVDHGDTACKTPDATEYVEKMWAHAASKKFATPADQERARESMRTRC